MNKFLRSLAQVVLASAISIGLITGCTPTTAERGPVAPTVNPTATPTSMDLSSQLQQLESEHAARIGVSAFDTGTGQTIAYRADERFGYASTLKAFVAAGFLSEIPATERDTVVTWTQDDIDAAGYSPVTSEHISGGLSLAQLAESAVRSSDNTATNIILRNIGGPAGLQQILRAAGDDTTEVVHDEPALNLIQPGSTNDTTTPAAFTDDLRVFLTGTVLNESDKATLREWMSNNATGDSLIRAGTPDGWDVADKSGGAYGIRNDIAIITPPDRAPIILTILTATNDPHAKYDDRLVADTAQTVLDALT